jgi:hypothetical protein
MIPDPARVPGESRTLRADAPSATMTLDRYPAHLLFLRRLGWETS